GSDRPGIPRTPDRRTGGIDRGPPISRRRVARTTHVHQRREETPEAACGNRTPAHDPQHAAHPGFARARHNGRMNPTTRILGPAPSLLLAPPARAQAPPRPAPPQEAVAACAGRETGAACSFEHYGHSVPGSCNVIPGGPPAARPPPHLYLHHGPPPEA